MNQRTVLGFDFGLRRIGVAVGQELTGGATALTTLEADNGAPDWAAVRGLIDEWQAEAFVVGLPLNDDGSEHDISKAARRFGNRLQGRFEKPVYWMDERLSSHEAEARLGPLRQKTHRRNIDKVAAQIILESWLSQRHS